MTKTTANRSERIGARTIGLRSSRPQGSGPERQDVDRSAAEGAVVGLVAIQANRAAVFSRRSGREQQSAHRHFVTGQIIDARTGRFDVRLLRPDSPRAAEQVHRAAVRTAVVGLVSVQTGRAAVLVV